MMFETTRVIRFGDCDPAGIAYFPSYVGMLADSMEIFFAEGVGVPFTESIHKRRLGCPTARLDIEFLKPGHHGDALSWRVIVEAVGGASARLRHEIWARGALLWRARQVVVCTSLETHRPTPWPDDMRAGLARFMEAPDAHPPSA